MFVGSRSSCHIPTILQQHTETITASPPPTDIDHPSTTGGTEPSPPATDIDPAICDCSAPRIPTAVRDAPRLALGASRAAIQPRRFAAAAQTIVCLYRRTRSRVEQRISFFPHAAAFYVLRHLRSVLAAKSNSGLRSSTYSKHFRFNSDCIGNIFLHARVCPHQ